MNKKCISYILVLSIVLSILFGFENRVVYANNSPPPEITFNKSGNASLANIDNQSRFKLLTIGGNLADTEFVYQNWVYKVKKFDYTYYTSESYTYYENEPYTYTETTSNCIRTERLCNGTREECLCARPDGSTYTFDGHCTRAISCSYKCVSYYNRCAELEKVVKQGVRQVEKTGTRSVANHHTLLPANITVNQVTNTFSLPSSGTVTMERVRKHEIPVKLKFDVEGIKELTVNGKKIDNIKNVQFA